MFAIVILTYLAMLSTIMLSCLPIQRNWQVRPLPPVKCSFRRQNFIVCAVLNTTTDAAILCIPIPLIYSMRVSLPKKIFMCALLCSGIFLITAAIVRVVMTLDAHPSAMNINRWGMRETIFGICAVNAPIITPRKRISYPS